MSLPKDACLQCEQTRAEVAANNTICGIESGYEYRELEAEWPRHHWRDWSNPELEAAGILPEHFDLYRREAVSAIHYTPCEHSRRGHDFPRKDIYFGTSLIHSKDECMNCGRRKELDD